ncbi:hypothetical protein D3C71_1447070 [compost metagenome]
MTAMAQVARRVLDVVHVDPFDLAPVVDRPDAGLVVGTVGADLPLESHGLQPSAVRQLARNRGNEAIEEAVALILGQVGDAGARVYADGLVIEAAHGFQRHGIDQTGGVGGDFEHPAVDLGHVGVGWGLDRLLAGQPAAPGRVAAAAVGRGADQRQVLTHRLTGFEVVDQGRRAAGQGAAVLVGIVGLGGVQQAEALVVEAAGSHVAVKRL